MKKRLLPAVIILILIVTSCGKNKATEDVIVHPIPNVLSDWSWLNSSGGIAGVYLTPESTGYTQRLEFWQDSTARMYRGDTLWWIDTFTVEIRKWIADNTAVPMLVYKHGHSVDQYFNISQNGDTLYLYDNVVDGFSHEYLNIILPLEY